MYSNSNTMDNSENLRKWCQSSLIGASLSTATLIVTFKKICCYYGNKQNRCSVLTVSPTKCHVIYARCICYKQLLGQDTRNYLVKGHETKNKGVGGQDTRN